MIVLNLKRKLCFLANLCNSMIIEMCDDIIRVSHGFDGCQMLEYIAESKTSLWKTGNYDIIKVFCIRLLEVLLD